MREYSGFYFDFGHEWRFLGRSKFIHEKISGTVTQFLTISSVGGKRVVLVIRRNSYTMWLTNE